MLKIELGSLASANVSIVILSYIPMHLVYAEITAQRISLYQPALLTYKNKDLWVGVFSSTTSILSIGFPTCLLSLRVLLTASSTGSLPNYFTS